MWVFCLRYLSSSLQELLDKIVRSRTGMSSHVSSDKSKSRSLEMSVSRPNTTQARSVNSTAPNNTQTDVSLAGRRQSKRGSTQSTKSGSDPNAALDKFKSMVRRLSLLGTLVTVAVWGIATLGVLSGFDKTYRNEEECAGEDDKAGCGEYIYGDGGQFLLQLLALYILFSYAWGPLEMTCKPDKSSTSMQNLAEEASIGDGASIA